MKKYTLDKIKLTNFQGQSMEVEFEQTNRIYWPNKKGKTRLRVALLWLLTGADHLNRANYRLFDERRPLTAGDSPKAEVEAWLTSSTGEHFNIKRTAQAQWSRSGERVPSDKYEIFVDGMKMAATAFKSFLAMNFADVAVLKQMLNPMHYQNIEWKELSELLYGIVGEITAEDYKADYSSVEPLIAKYGEDKVIGLLNDKIRVAEIQLSEHERVIENMQAQLPDLSDVAFAENEFEYKERQLAKLNAEIDDLQAGGNAAMQEYRSKCERHQKALTAYNERQTQYYYKQSYAARSAERKLRERDTKSAELTEAMAELEAARDVVRTSRVELHECPYCHRPYDDAKQEELRKQYIEKGKQMAERVETLRAELAQMNKFLLPLQAKAVAFDKTAEGAKMLADLRALELECVPPAPTENLVQALNFRAELETEIRKLKSTIEKKSEYAAKIASIEDAKAHHRDMTAEMVADEGTVALLKKRHSEKLAIIKERIEQYLSASTVAVSATSKSNNVKATCTLLMDGVPTDTANHADQTLAGLDLSLALMRRYGVMMPIFFDDAEHITTELPQLDTQSIMLFASTRDVIEH